jgi:hypothetical protein
MLVFGVVIPSNFIWPLVIIVLACLATFVYVDRDERHRRLAQELEILRLNEQAREKSEKVQMVNMDTGFVSIHVHKVGDKSSEIVNAEVKINLPDPRIGYTKIDGSAIFTSIPQKYMGKEYDIIVKHKDYKPSTREKQLLVADQAVDISMEPLHRNKSVKTEWKIRVFNFNNHGQKVEHARVGENFAGFILNSLIKLDLDAKRIAKRKTKIKFTFVVKRSPEPEIDWAEFIEYMPFIAILGFTSPVDDANFEATIRVVNVNSGWPTDIIYIEEIICAYQPESMKEAAYKIAEKVRDALLKLPSPDSKEL